MTKDEFEEQIDEICAGLEALIVEDDYDIEEFLNDIRLFIVQ